MKRVIAGRYIEGDSPVHQLDPRAKAAALVAFIAYLLIWPNIFGHALGLCLLYFGTRLAKIEISRAVGFIVGARFFFYMVFLVHTLFTPGAGGYSWWIFSISAEGILNGLLFGIRLICLIWTAALFSWTTSPVELADGFRKTLSPLRKIGINVDDISTMLLLSMRFVPTLIQDARELRYAQEARGAEFFKGGLIRRVKSVAPLIIPLFVGAFRRADATAIALKVRGYELEGEHTSLYPLEFGLGDWAGMAVALGIVTLAIAGRIISM